MELAKTLRPLTKDDALKSFKELVEAECKEPNPYDRRGLDCLDFFFFHHRLRAKTRRGISFTNAIKNRKTLKYINEKIIKVRDKNPKDLDDKSLFQIRYNLFQLYYGSINQFRPTEAKRLYCLLRPKKGILDFSAGWGGRCLAAISLGIPYIGIDANKNLESSYNQMFNLLNVPKGQVKMEFAPAETVDYSKYHYDLIFTSPPYFFLEKYEKMPQYKDKQDFLDNFFYKTVMNSWKHLDKNGFMALNIPKEMYEYIKPFLPKVFRKIHLRMSSRHAVNAARGKTIGSSKQREIIYIWSKRNITGRKTRKIRTTKSSSH